VSANEQAEAFLIVVKRLLKWMGFAALVIAALVAAVLGYEEYERYVRDKPRLLTEYAEVKLGDSADQVRYVLGAPAAFLDRTPEEADKPWTKDPRVVRADDAKEGHLIVNSTGWQYDVRTNTQINVSFDAPAPSGKVIAVACYSQTVYSCPEVFGLRDGSSEEEVLKHLGKPDSDTIESSAKVLRYEAYNLTLYLVKKRVYMVTVTTP